MKIEEMNNILTWMSFGQTMKCVIFFDDSNKNVIILFDVMLTFENEIHLNVGRKSEN